MNTTHNDNMQRDRYWDCVKGIAIVLVLLGHSIQYGNGELYFSKGLCFDNLAYKLIYGFHMPLFMFVSGYFFYITNTKRTLKQNMYKMALSLLVPIVSFSFIARLLCGIDLSIYGIIRFVGSSVLGIFNTLWFLWGVMLCSMVTGIISRFFKDRVIYHCLIIVAAYILPDYYHLPEIKFVYPFFVFGYYANKESMIEKLFSKKIGVGLIFLSLYVLLVYTLMNRELFVYTTKISILTSSDKLHQLYCDIMRLIIGTVGVFAFISIFRRIYLNYKNENLYKILSHLGIKSMGLYCFQYLLMTRIPMLTPPNMLITSTVLSFILLSTLSYVLTFLAERNVLTKRILLGGR